MTYCRKSTFTENPFTDHAAALLRQRTGDPQITGSSKLLYECDYTAFGRIADKVHSTFPVCEIDRICQVNAPQMYGMYLLRKEEMQMQCTGRPYATEVQELELFHVTTESKGNESLKNGLDWRRTRRSKFGRGVSFSDDADYADYYANNTCDDGRRVIIVCTVLVAKMWRVNNNNKNKRFPGRELIVPPGTCDTTVSPNGRVYVKYYDHEFYPLYMVYYRRRPEHVAISRYNKNKTGVAGHEQRFTLAEMERRQREKEERERRQKEEKLQYHQTLVQQQQKHQAKQKEQEQRQVRQNQQEERLQREKLARSNQHRRQQQKQAYGGSHQSNNHSHHKESCFIL